MHSRKLLAQAYLHLRRGEREACRGASLRAVKLSKDPHRLIRAGSLLARAGYPQDAEGLIELLDATLDAPILTVARHRIRGEVLLARGDAAAALVELRQADLLEVPVAEREYLARAHEAAGNLEAAYPHYLSLFENPARVVRDDRLWPVLPGFWADAVRRTAILADRLGKEADARRALRAYHDLRGESL